MRLKIISDGNPLNTSIIDMDTGHDIRNSVVSINWYLEAGEVANVTLTVRASVELESDDITVVTKQRKGVDDG